MFQYITADGHLMMPNEIMYRVENSVGSWWGGPLEVTYHTKTGYNNGDTSLNPFDDKHVHFFSFELAEEYLRNKRK